MVIPLYLDFPFIERLVFLDGGITTYMYWGFSSFYIQSELVWTGVAQGGPKIIKITGRFDDLCSLYKVSLIMHRAVLHQNITPDTYTHKQTATQMDIYKRWGWHVLNTKWENASLSMFMLATTSYHWMTWAKLRTPTLREGSITKNLTNWAIHFVRWQNLTLARRSMKLSQTGLKTEDSRAAFMVLMNLLR